jgi:hypothetical protein
LDDWEFEDFVESTVAKIPELTDKWTDYNPTDPGVTLLELLSWLAASQLFHMDQITDDHKRAFLKLLGSEPRPTYPSSYIVPIDGYFGLVRLPAHSRRVFEPAGSNIILETGPEQSFYAVGIHEIKRDYLNVKSEAVNISEDGISTAPLFTDNPIPGDNFSVSLKFNGTPDGKVRLYFELSGAPLGKLPVDAFVYLSSLFTWEYVSSTDDGEFWKPFANEGVISDGTYRLTRSGILEFVVPDDISVNDGGGVQSIKIRGRLKEAPLESAAEPVYFERTPLLKQLTPNPIIVYAKATIVNSSDVVRAKANVPDPVEIHVPFDPNYWEYVVQKRENNTKPWTDLGPDNFQVVTGQGNIGPLITVENPGDAEFRLVYWEKHGLVGFSAGVSVTGTAGEIVEFPVEVAGDYSGCDYFVQWRKKPDDLWAYLGPEKYTIQGPAGRRTIKAIVDNVEAGEVRLVISTENPPFAGLSVKASGLPGFDKMELPAPALPGLVVQVEESPWKWFDWDETDDLRSVGKKDRYFTMSLDRRRLIFGDGRNGRVPPAPTGGTPNVRVIMYATSEGYGGEVPSTARYEIGRRSETIKKAVWRTREDLAEPPVAVTLEDYEHFALATPGLEVARSEALVVPVESKVWSFCKKKTLIETPDVHRVVVVVIPDTDRRPPEPGTAFLRTVRRYLERFRVVTTRLDVEAPVYVFISLRVTIVVSAGYAHGEVAKSVRDALVGFLDPLVGGEEKSGWRLGRSISRSGIIAVVESVTGMDRVTDFRVWPEGQVIPDGPTDELHLNWKALPFLLKERVYVETTPSDDICR